MEGTVDFPWNPIPTDDVVQLLAIECRACGMHSAGRHAAPRERGA